MGRSGTRCKLLAACCAHVSWSRRRPCTRRAACRAHRRWNHHRPCNGGALCHARRRWSCRHRPCNGSAACRAHRSRSRRRPCNCGAPCHVGTSYGCAAGLGVVQGVPAVLPKLLGLPVPWADWCEWRWLRSDEFEMVGCLLKGASTTPARTGTQSTQFLIFRPVLLATTTMLAQKCASWGWLSLWLKPQWN